MGVIKCPHDIPDAGPIGAREHLQARVPGVRGANEEREKKYYITSSRHTQRDTTMNLKKTQRKITEGTA